MSKIKQQQQNQCFFSYSVLKKIMLDDQSSLELDNWADKAKMKPPVHAIIHVSEYNYVKISTAQPLNYQEQ